MKTTEHPLDPHSLSLEDNIFNSLSGETTLDSRQLFCLLQHTEVDLSTLAAAWHFLRKALKSVEAKSLQSAYTDQKITTLSIQSIPALPSKFHNALFQKETLHQSAPILLTQLTWLHNICPASCSQTQFSLQLQAVYKLLCFNASGHADLLPSCRALLETTGRQSSHIIHKPFSRHHDILSVIIDFATIQLALGFFPRLLFPEILGFTLAYCQTPDLINICHPDFKIDAPFFNRHQRRKQKAIAKIQQNIQSYLMLFNEDRRLLWSRIQQGFHLYPHALNDCRNQLNHFFSQPLSVVEQLGQMLQKKLPAAFGHHAGIELQGISLEQWLHGLPGNRDDFLKALRLSRYVDQNHPENSRLLQLFTFNGPMYGVFTASEQELWRKWLNNQSADHPIPPHTSPKPIVPSRQVKKQPSSLSNRDLYHKLINLDLAPDIQPLVEKWLSQRLRYCTLFSISPFKHFDHARFDDYIESCYRREVDAYQPLHGSPKISKPAYIWGIEQIAPMILIDGCWLQNSLRLQAAHPEISEILFRIYDDELGNGQLEQNHPAIFQRLLESLTIELPPVHSLAFSKHRGFIDSAFDLPVFMLALASFSGRFLPELLGLNMAIELSGLGKGYLKLVDEWRYWNIDPRIAMVHITIDNAASGHTFQAQQAIHLYLDEILRKSSQAAEVDRYWRRIWTGYACLRLIGWRFKLQLPVFYGLKKMVTSQNARHVK